MGLNCDNFLNLYYSTFIVVFVWVTRELLCTLKCILYNIFQIFENRGAINGCSNNHPHCQVGSYPEFVSAVFKSYFVTQNNNSCKPLIH